MRRSAVLTRAEHPYAFVQEVVRAVFRQRVVAGKEAFQIYITVCFRLASPPSAVLS